MKSGASAAEQYSELAEALRLAGAGWVVLEVEEVVTRGKVVPLRNLPADQQVPYVERLAAETQKGFRVGKARAADEVGVPYEDHERLVLLVDATRRVVSALARSHVEVSEFARNHQVSELRMLLPAAGEEAGNVDEAIVIPMRDRAEAEGKLYFLMSFLDRVLD